MTELAQGRYVLVDRIAAGGMGEVWRARDTALARDVAVKLLRSEMADDAAFRSRFATEAKNAAALHDPGIATVFDYGDEVDQASGRHTTYLVMELVDGAPLSDLISGPMAPSSAAHLVGQTADGLAVAHAAGIVHRDVKPANFIITPDGRVKITDFGIARARGDASITDTGAIMGTPHYVAPEIAEGREATPASDIYSLGVVLYECLTGVRPFTGDTPIAVAMAHLRDTPPSLPPSVPPGLRSLVEAALDKDPARRPPSAAAFAEAVRAAAEPVGSDAATVALAGSPPTRVLPAPADPAPGGPPPRRRSAGWIPVVAAAIAVLLIAGIAYSLLNDQGADPQDDPAAAETSPTGSQSQDNSTTTPPSETTTPTTPTTPTTTTTPAGVFVDPEAYIGQKAPDAKRALEELGLTVVEEEVEGGEKHIVADVSPSGDVPAESTVTLLVFKGAPPGHEKPPPGPKEDDGPAGTDKDKGRD